MAAILTPTAIVKNADSLVFKMRQKMVLTQIHYSITNFQDVWLTKGVTGGALANRKKRKTEESPPQVTALKKRKEKKRFYRSLYR